MIGLLSAQGQPTITKNEELNFALEVKQIDEFIERFNFQENTMLLQYVEENYPGQNLDRESLIRSLFNESNPKAQQKVIDEFVAQITNPLRPVVIDFMENDWYAAVKCMVKYRGKVETPTLILQIQQGPDLSAKWIVRSIRADFLRFPEKSNPEHFLNPISHSTDFMGLRKAMNNLEHLPDYTFQDYEPDLLSVFLFEIMKGNLQFVQTNEITYHFLQVDGWIFQVNRHLRNTRNSGWLIDHLSRANESTKTYYRKHVLSLH